MRFEEWLEQGQRGAQAADRDPHLVHAFGIACQARRLIGQQMTETDIHDLSKRFSAVRPGIDHGVFRLVRLGFGTVRQPVAAGTLAFGFKHQRRGGMKFTRQPIERCGLAAAQFQFEFVDRLIACRLPQSDLCRRPFR